MLVIHPDSNCDICLEQFAPDSPNKAPHATRCGHVFCLRCLKSLSRRVCPMCRNPFHPTEVTRIHLDQRSSPTPGSSSSPGPTSPFSPNFSDPSSALARELHDRINAFVSTGASTSVAHALTDDCKSFFQDHSPSSYMDFYVTYQLLNHFLLGYYRAFFQDPAAADKSLHKFQAEVQAYHQSWENRYRRLTRNIEDLAEKLRLETIAKENEMQERQTAEAVIQSLKDELQAQESWWHWKYEELRRKYVDLQGEVSELRGAQIQVMVAQCPAPNFAIEKAVDGLFEGMKENEPPSLLIPSFTKSWDALFPSKGSPQLPTYDYATSIEGCLSIISTPRVDECALRDESEMKEILSDLLTDPLPPRRRIFKPISHKNYDTSSSLHTPSSKHVTASSDSSHQESTLTSTVSNSFASAPMSISVVSDTVTSASSHTQSPPVPASDPRPQPQTVPPTTTPEVPLWTRKRSLRPTPYARDAKGKGASTAQSLSANDSD